MNRIVNVKLQVNKQTQVLLEFCLLIVFLLKLPIVPIKMDKDKKKRSPNYTLEEKEHLLSIITKYQSVIECKRTGAYYIQKKQEAWKSITKEYNSLCTTGPRDETMLKHFYNNIKHRARKDSANENKQRYLNTLSDETNIVEVPHPPENNQTEQHLNVDEVIVVNEHLIKDLKKKWSNEQTNLKKTGGGSFTPILTDADHQILSILDDQIRPDENPYDEAAEYFGEQIEVISKESNPVPESNPLPVPPNPVPVLRKQKLVPKRKKKTIDSLSHIKHSAEALKKIYFKKKIELAYYQKRNEMQKFRFEQKKHELEIQILRKQLEKADRDLM